jgi:hypothetical protein
VRRVNLPDDSRSNVPATALQAQPRWKETGSGKNVSVAKLAASTSLLCSRHRPISRSPALSDLNEPHIVRALHHLKIEAIYTGHSAYHAVCVDSRGNAHFIGRNTHSCFGVSADTKPSTKALEEYTVHARSLRGASRENRIVHAACGRGHTVLVGSDGKAWSAGLNTSAQCGQVSVLGTASGGGLSIHTTAR